MISQFSYEIWKSSDLCNVNVFDGIAVAAVAVVIVDNNFIVLVLMHIVCAVGCMVCAIQRNAHTHTFKYMRENECEQNDNLLGN